LFAKGALRARGLLTSRSEVTQTPKVPKRKATRSLGPLRFAPGQPAVLDYGGVSRKLAFGSDKRDP